MSVDAMALAKAAVSEAEICALRDQWLGVQQGPDEPRLMLAHDLICDAALEVAGDQRAEKSIGKMVDLGAAGDVNLRDCGVYAALSAAYASGAVSGEEINALLLKGSVAPVISKALNNGLSPEDIAKSTVRIRPIGFGQFLE